jgi:hypothetical protein
MHNTLCHISSVWPKVFWTGKLHVRRYNQLISLLIDPHYKYDNVHKLMSRWSWPITIAIVPTLKSLCIFQRKIASIRFYVGIKCRRCVASFPVGGNAEDCLPFSLFIKWIPYMLWPIIPSGHDGFILICCGVVMSRSRRDRTHTNQQARRWENRIRDEETNKGWEHRRTRWD